MKWRAYRLAYVWEMSTEEIEAETLDEANETDWDSLTFEEMERSYEDGYWECSE